MKYIIEIEDQPFTNGYAVSDDGVIVDEQKGEELYRVKGFKSLVFDKATLDKLEKCREDAVFGEDECRHYIFYWKRTGGVMIDEALEKAFPVGCIIPLMGVWNKSQINVGGEWEPALIRRNEWL